MGGSPEELPERYDVADPLRLPALEIPVLLVHGAIDRTVSVKPARRYAKRAHAAGQVVELIEIEGPAGSPPRPHRPAQPGVDGGDALVRSRRRRRQAGAVALGAAVAMSRSPGSSPQRRRLDTGGALRSLR